MDFYKRFDIKIKIDDARDRFVNRVHNNIVPTLTGVFSVEEQNELGLEIANFFGEKYIISGYLHYVPRHEFFDLLACLEIIHNFCNRHTNDELIQAASQFLDETIPDTIRRSEIDLEIRWEKGKFIKSGAELLDEKLVNDVLAWLRQKEFTSVLLPFEKSLGHFTQADRNEALLSDVVTDAYEALEAIAKIVTGRYDKDLSANREFFVSSLNVSGGYKEILEEYIEYANQYRHAGVLQKPKPNLSKHEVESFIYLTGLFIRLAMESLPKE